MEVRTLDGVDPSAFEAAWLVLASREVAWTPSAWLSEPHWFTRSWRLLMPHVCGEFEERRKRDG